MWVTRWIYKIWVIWCWRVVSRLRYFVFTITYNFQRYPNLGCIVRQSHRAKRSACHDHKQLKTIGPKIVLVNLMIVFFILKNILIYICEFILQSPVIAVETTSTSRSLICLDKSNVVRVVAQLRIPFGISDVLSVKTICVA